MHAILSLGATHYGLAAPNGSHYSLMAIAHRGKALEYLSTALKKVDSCTAISLDGILATCYALVFQAYYMRDGLVDFAVMVRGCTLVTNCIQARFIDSRMFSIQSHEQVAQLVGPWLSTDAHPDYGAIDLCIRDIDQLRPLLQSEGTMGFFKALREIYLALFHSIRDGFSRLTEVYIIWHSMENQQFVDFMASDNHIARALFLHYLAIDTLMRPFLLSVRGPKHTSLSLGAVVMDQWAHAVYCDLPAMIQHLVKYQVELINRGRSGVYITFSDNSY